MSVFARVIGLGFALGCAAPAGAEPRVPQYIYVDDSAPAGGDGTAWYKAYNDLHLALDQVRANPTPDGDIIRMAEGVYRPYQFGQTPRAFCVPSNTTIMGGYKAIFPSPRDPIGTPTIITGDITGDDTAEGGNRAENATTVLACWDEGQLPTIVRTTSVVIDGLTIERAGLAGPVVDAGPGMAFRSCTTRLNYGSITLQPDSIVEDCRFTDNFSRVFAVVSKNAQGEDTGAIFTISRCDFARNGAFLDDATRLDGTGAFRIEGATLHAMDCTFLDHGSKPTALVRLEDGFAPAPGVTHDHVFVRCAFERTGAPVFHHYPKGYRQFMVLTDCRFVDTWAELFYNKLSNGFDATKCEFLRNYPIQRLRQPSRFHDCTFTHSTIEVQGVVYAYSPFDRTTFEGCSFETAVVYANGSADYVDCAFTGSLSDTRVVNGQVVSLRDCSFGVDLGQTSGRYVVQASMSLAAVRCDFVGCTAFRAISGGATTLESCRFVGSDITQLIVGTSVGMHNCFIADNNGGIGTTIIATTHLSATGSTLVNNTGTVFSSSATSKSLANSIVWGNRRPGSTASTESQQLGSFATSSSVIDSCIVEGWTGSIAAANTTGADPLFLDPLGPDVAPNTGDEDYRLTVFSPAIDAGNTALLPADTFDLDGDGDTTEPTPFDVGGAPRLVAGPSYRGVDAPVIVDIGAYEYQADCNGNGVLDLQEIADGTSQDCNLNEVPDECEIDCDGDGVPDECEITSGEDPDCTGNGIPDSCDIAHGTSPDCNENGIPDECETESDCNSNGIPDDCDIAIFATSPDCNDNAIPDECEDFADCNDNGIPDECDIGVFATSEDCNLDTFPDECRTEVGYTVDDGIAYANRNLSLTFIFSGSTPTPPVLSTILLSQHTVEPGGELINEVEFFGGSREEISVFLVIYDDPDNNGDVNDATLIAAYPVEQQWLSYTGEAAYRTQSIPATYVGEPGDSFFVGLWFTYARYQGADLKWYNTFAGFVRSICHSERCFLKYGVGQSSLGFLGDDTIRSLRWYEQNTFTFWVCALPPTHNSGAISMHIRPRTLRAYDCDLNLSPDVCDSFPDINANGVPDECECPGDVTGDGRTDVYDFTMLALGFGRTVAFWFDGDLTGDGAVDVADFCILAAKYGDVCKDPPTPTRSPIANQERVFALPVAP